jgi:biotin carboxyl carrier protein
MKRLINGEEVELSLPDDFTVIRTAEGLRVRGPDGTHSAAAVRSGDTVHVSYKGRVWQIDPIRHGLDHAGGEAEGERRAQLPGQVIEVAAANGDQVEEGAKVLVLEAMKMQREITAPFAGTVAHLDIKKGDQVAEGDLLFSVEPD